MRFSTAKLGDQGHCLKCLALALTQVCSCRAQQLGSLPLIYLQMTQGELGNQRYDKQRHYMITPSFVIAKIIITVLWWPRIALNNRPVRFLANIQIMYKISYLKSINFAMYIQAQFHPCELI